MHSAPLTITETPSFTPPIPVANKIATPSTYTVMELFAGAGGLALGFEKAGFRHLLLNDQDCDCCQTLTTNRPHWPIKQAPIATLNFTDYYNQIDVIAGGFPCQAFSLLGKRQGLHDPRGRCVFDYIRAIQTVRPSIALAENVKGLRSHNQGKTLNQIIKSIAACGYRVLPPRLLKAIDYCVPQRRERLFIVAIRDDLAGEFIWPTPHNITYTLRDALKAGQLFCDDAPPSVGYRYSTKRHALLDQVPPGKNWRALPNSILQTWKKQTRYQGSQTAKRLSWEEPCLTLLTKPVAGLTERCHPDETRPLTVREYARIQTFPDDWQFCGTLAEQYRQIGNAVPVNLATAMASAIKDFLDRATPHTYH